jgi:hypothetical protein
MDNSNSITKSILESDNNVVGNGNSWFSSNSVSSSTSSTATSGFTGMFSFMNNINGVTWFIIILILAFLGFNIFVYLAKGTQDIVNFANPILKSLFGITIGVTGEVVDLTAEGAKTVVNTTANVLDTGLTAIQDLTPEGKRAETSIQSSSPQTAGQSPDVMSNNSLNKTLNTNQYKQQQPTDYQADEAKSSVNSSSQSGWCYIGEDKGYRSCAQVGNGDTCMSGDIFPSQEICVNPNLRP